MQKSFSEQPIPFISHGWLIQSYSSALQKTLVWFGLSVAHLIILCNAPLCVPTFPTLGKLTFLFYLEYITFLIFKLQVAFSVSSFLKTKHCNFLNNIQIHVYVCVQMKYQWHKLPWKFLVACSEFCTDIANSATVLSLFL